MNVPTAIFLIHYAKQTWELSVFLEQKLYFVVFWISLPIRLYSCVYKMLGLDKKINMIIPL